ncbi:MAG: hypothetical protein GY743_06910, partial [Planctomycetaceae bacterium]|nr:hypothetical protein [Planctomycetaceae bacterium]
MAYIVFTSNEDRFRPDVKFINKPEEWKMVRGVGHGRSGQGVPFEPVDKAPREIEIDGKWKWKTLPDYFSIREDLGVSQAFKDILEEQEPGAHQFFPLDVRRKDGGPVEGQYYLFVVSVLLDTALIPEKSNVIQKGIYKEYPSGRISDHVYYAPSGPGPTKLTLNKAIIG